MTKNRRAVVTIFNFFFVFISAATCCLWGCAQAPNQDSAKESSVSTVFTKFTAADSWQLRWEDTIAGKLNGLALSPDGAVYTGACEKSELGDQNQWWLATQAPPCSITAYEPSGKSSLLRKFDNGFYSPVFFSSKNKFLLIKVMAAARSGFEFWNGLSLEGNSLWSGVKSAVFGPQEVYATDFFYPQLHLGAYADFLLGDGQVAILNASQPFFFGPKEICADDNESENANVSADLFVDHNDIIYLRCRVLKKIAAYNPRRNNKIAQYPEGTPIAANNQGNLVLVTDDGQIQAYSLSGKLLWQEAKTWIMNPRLAIANGEQLLISGQMGINTFWVLYDIAQGKKKVIGPLENEEYALIKGADNQFYVKYKNKIEIILADGYRRTFFPARPQDQIVQFEVQPDGRMLFTVQQLNERQEAVATTILVINSDLTTSFIQAAAEPAATAQLSGDYLIIQAQDKLSLWARLKN